VIQRKTIPIQHQKQNGNVEHIMEINFGQGHEVDAIIITAMETKPM